VIQTIKSATNNSQIKSPNIWKVYSLTKSMHRNIGKPQVLKILISHMSNINFDTPHKARYFNIMQRSGCPGSPNPEPTRIEVQRKTMPESEFQTRMYIKYVRQKISNSNIN